MGMSMPSPSPITRLHRPPARRRLALAGGGACVLAATVLWLGLRDRGPEPPPPGPAAAGDVVTLAEGAPQWSYIELAVAEEQPALMPPPVPGRVEFDEKRSAAAASPLPGRVEEVRVRLGDQVKAGDRLLAVRSGALADLDREVESARSEVTAKTRVAQRARELVALRAAPEKDQLEAEEDLRQAQLSLKAATAKRESLNATIEGDTRFWITAPQDGTVVELAVSAGQEVGPDREKPLLRLSNIDQVLVSTDIQEQDAYDLRVGQPVTVRTPAGDVTRPGVIERVSQVVDPQRRTVEVRVRVQNADRVLRPNAFVEVALAPDPSQRRVRVPADAVVSDGEQSVVFVTREAGRLERTPVTVGRRREGEVELRSGLEPGTRYVAKGAILLLNQLELAD
jgi:cobalt-zinc-cadmium efflux system membrane fusion protein